MVVALGPCGSATAYGSLGAGVQARDPAPSAGDVARGKEAVKDRAAEVGRLTARLAAADGELDSMAVKAETAVERYNGERVKLERARAAHAAALLRLGEAERQYETVRTETIEFAAGAYRAGTLDPWAGLVAGRGGPQWAMDRAELIEVMSHRRADVMRRVEAARDVAALFRSQAAAALRDHHESLRRAETAKREAEDAVDKQRSAVTRLTAEKHRTERLLHSASVRARRLEDAREAALEAKRLRALAAKTAREGAGSGRGAAGLLKGSRRGAAVVRAALRWLGTPYSWGGGNAYGPSYGIAHGAHIKGFDCSGLALHAWAQVGVRLDHWTGTQWTSGPHVPLSSLSPGDLVFFAHDTDDPDTIHHVGIYLSRGQMVEAPYTGARVRISSIYRRGLIGATRPAG
ncbi:NlpC/P60 family protein [Thermomonospora umbrina]|uniref:Cell wall-associated NlpC family hydrolase n=1 Tax=Thermomonospora umbrina TaxID=111806 RepID=A0A3D9SPU5_9ACTN|nr:NlpC/P60 family protein [Thermomonospora umbrina]REE97928.1 cell wall-associated NlpC family hydrolase [Thermomonospora umbrina]